MVFLYCLLLFIPEGTGLSGVAYPEGSFFIQISPAALSLNPDREDIGFSLEEPTLLNSLFLRYHNFGIETDGRTRSFLGFGNSFKNFYLGGKIGMFKFNPDSVGVSLSPGGFVSFPFFQFGGAGNFDIDIYNYSLSLSFTVGSSFAFKNFRTFIDLSFKDSDFTPRIGFSYRYSFGKFFLDEFGLSLGLSGKEPVSISGGIFLTRVPFSLYAAYAQDKLFTGVSFSFKKRVLIKRVVQKVVVEKPIPVEPPKPPPKKPPPPKKKEEKPRELTEEEKVYIEYHYIKGIEYYKQDLLEKAIEEWEKVAEIDPEYRDVKKNLEEAKKKYEILKSIQEQE